MAVTTSGEDGFREIQLNGKQLVFLFMAVTVVLVVTFLTGVLVGRGVRAERAEAEQAEALSDAPPAPARAPESTANVDDPRTAIPPAPVEEDPEPPVAAPRNVAPAASAPAATPAEPPKAPETSTAAASLAAKPATPSAPPAAQPGGPRAASAPSKAPETATVAAILAAKPATPSAPPAAPDAPAAAATQPSDPRAGYAVQVAAVNVRGEADAIVKRLSGKGYTAYVEVPKNSTSVFRVRVGTFSTRREAQTVADKLKREEKFKPWVTR